LLHQQEEFDTPREFLLSGECTVSLTVEKPGKLRLIDVFSDMLLISKSKGRKQLILRVVPLAFALMNPDTVSIGTWA